MLHASDTSSATTDVVRSLMRVVPSPRCTKASKNPVQECTSNSRSGRSIFGSIFSTRLRSQVSDFGSPSAPSFSTFSFARPPGMTSMLTFASVPAPSSRSAICFHPASSALTSSARCSSTATSRLRPARTSSRTASHSHRWSDPRARLLDGAEWEAVRDDVLAGLSLDVAVEEHLAELVRALEAGWKQMAERLEGAGTDAKVSIEVMPGGRAKLNVEKLGALGEPKSLTWLRKRVEKMLPKT